MKNIICKFKEGTETKARNTYLTCKPMITEWLHQFMNIENEGFNADLKLLEPEARELQKELREYGPLYDQSIMILQLMTATTTHDTEFDWSNDNHICKEFINKYGDIIPRPLIKLYGIWVWG